MRLRELGTSMVKYIYDFSEGDKSMKDLLGGEGANLAEMTKLSLPVPPEFTITAEACRAYLKSSLVPESLATEVTAVPRGAEDQVKRTLSDPDNLLLVSVRSGAKFSTPDMMEAVLNISLNDQSILGLARISDSGHFAWGSYRRLIQIFGKTVLDIDGDLFSGTLGSLKAERGVTGGTGLTAENLKGLVVTFKKIVSRQKGMDFPQDPRAQMDMVIETVFCSWNTKRTCIYRRRERAPRDPDTAINIYTMIFGNMDEDSETGVCFTHDPSSGHSSVYDDYLENAQGENVVAGIRSTFSLADLEGIDKASYDRLRGIVRKPETHYRDMCDIGFTIERGKLWILRTRVGKRAAAAAFRIAIRLVEEKLITRDEALARVTGDQLTQLMFPRFSQETSKGFVARGMVASPGAAIDRITFDNTQTEAFPARGVKCVLVHRKTNPDDLPDMVAAEGVLTVRGGKTSHTAVITRGMGETCVRGAETLEINAEARIVTIDGRVFTPDNTIAIDGQTGEIFSGDVLVTDSPITTYLAEGLRAGLAAAGANEGTREFVKTVDFILTHTDKVRHLRIRANANTPADSRRSIEFGIEEIDLCRTEHVFLGPRRPLVKRTILSASGSDEHIATSAGLEELQRQNFLEMLEVMDGKSMTTRLTDPPLHEFTPTLSELEIKVAIAKATGKVDPVDGRILTEVRRFHEQDPMLDLRGVRLGTYLPGLFALQMRALCEAAASLTAKGLDPKSEIMVPLVGLVRELQLIREEGEAIIAGVQEAHGINLSGATIGAMIGLPHAAMTAEDLTEEADFFSFGTNGLTRTVQDFSRDDVEGVFLPQYLEVEIFGISPFESIDVHSVGTLIHEDVTRTRLTGPGIRLGVCGEHGGDPASIHFFHEVDVDYVSCSPFRVPVARFGAGRTAILTERS